MTLDFDVLAWLETIEHWLTTLLVGVQSLAEWFEFHCTDLWLEIGTCAVDTLYMYVYVNKTRVHRISWILDVSILYLRWCSLFIVWISELLICDQLI